MTKDKIVSLFKILRDNDPEPVTELTFKSHFQLLVAVILLHKQLIKVLMLLHQNYLKMHQP